MIGIIVQYRDRIIVAVGPTLGFCEHVALSLLEDDGIDVGEEMLEYSTFDPTEPGGMLTGGDPELTDMEGWGLDGYTRPPG